MLRLKRAYDPPAPDDGQRILVERLWPRGLTKARAAIDSWMKDVAPSAALRKWFNHDPARWKTFQRRYWKELEQQPQAVISLAKNARSARVTLIYAARDEEHNGALALKAFLEHKRPKSTSKIGRKS